MKLQLDHEELRPLIKEVVRETLKSTEVLDAKMDDRIGFTEPEAAKLLGVNRHVLRDCRLRNEITARKVGKRYIYHRAALSDFLLRSDSGLRN